MFVSLLLFLSLVQGLMANYLDLHVRHLRVAENNGLDRTEINFKFEDPNTNATSACGAQFPNNGTASAPWFPDVYIACGTDPTFAWKIEEWRGAAAFQLDLRRSFRDPRVGEPPMDIVTMFAYQNVTEGDDYRCFVDNRGHKRCHTPRGKVIVFQLDGLIAKK